MRPNGPGSPPKPGGGSDTIDETHIELDELTPNALKMCLRHIYLNDTQIDEESICEVMEAANYLQLPGLKRACELILKENLDLENVIDVLTLADRTSAVQLKKICLDFVVNNYESVSQTKAFETLESHLSRDITSEACSLYQHTKAALPGYGF
eukprot:CAMPEP_0184662906 /NCGR_PEP_ID=MMETSP0308-20130426/45515_1 /TAXON_ID=38269 /ORGANISM="Gloeochaete witrockiana, Strain SAG 46.84" /LENGTH=152 /DNA_ID=CAMNT_0027105239 /DNA_START=32 /DNA_END=490 /DNA_ORIENTATION=+